AALGRLPADCDQPRKYGRDARALRPARGPRRTDLPSPLLVLVFVSVRNPAGDRYLRHIPEPHERRRTDARLRQDDVLPALSVRPDPPGLPSRPTYAERQPAAGEAL